MNYSLYLSSMNDIEMMTYLQPDLELLTTIFNSTPCTMSVVSKDLKCLMANKALKDIFNLTDEEFYNKPIGNFTEESDFVDFLKDLFDANKDTLVREVRTLKKDKVYYLTGKKIANGEKAILIGLDITELKKIEQEELHFQKLNMLNNLSAGIIHDIRNPLTILIAQTYKLEDKYPESEKIFKSMHKANMKINNMTDSLQALTEKPKNGTFEINDVVTEALLLSKGLYRSLHVTPEVELTKKDTKTSGVKVHLIQAILEVIQSCVLDRESDEFKLKIITKVSDDLIRIQIETNSNKDDSYYSGLFDEFRTKKHISKDSSNLYHAYKIVKEEHNGIVQVPISGQVKIKITIPKV